MVAERLTGEPWDEPGQEHRKLLATARRRGRAGRPNGSGRVAGRRACLALILCAALAACGKRGVLELPPEEEPAAGPPSTAPLEEEDDERLREEG
jgi:predicted small lipoprotein YifL